LKKKKVTSEFINKRVEKIQNNRIDNPTKIFTRVQPQCIQITTNIVSRILKKTIIKNKIIINKTISNISEIVLKKIIKAWKKVFITKRNKTIENHRIFKNKNFQDKRDKIINKDDYLTQKITKQEVETTVKKLSNSTVLSLNNISNDILKIMIKSKSFKIVLTNF
jgi:hypothetical protein